MHASSKLMKNWGEKMPAVPVHGKKGSVVCVAAHALAVRRPAGGADSKLEILPTISAISDIDTDSLLVRPFWLTIQLRLVRLTCSLARQAITPVCSNWQLAIQLKQKA